MINYLLTGDKRFDLGSYDPTVLEDLGSTIASFFMPADLLTFSGNDGEERVIKTPDGKLRLYRKELGAWYYLEFTRS